MKLRKKNIKLILGIIIVLLVTFSISVYATYTHFANEIIYLKSDGNQISVTDALNELYTNQKETSDDTKEITTNGEQTLDKYYHKLKVKVNDPIPKTQLWINSNPNSTLETFYMNLSSSLINFSHILVQWNVKINSTTIYEDIFKVQPYRLNTGTDAGVYGISCLDDSPMLIQRGIRYINDTTLYSGNALDSDSKFRTSYLIPIAIYGLKFSY